MDIKYELDPAGISRTIAVTIDLTAFALAECDIQEALHLTSVQLDAVRQPKLPPFIDGCINTLFHESGCLHSHNYVLPTIREVVGKGTAIKCVGIPLANEDHIFQMTPFEDDPKNYMKSKILGHCVTLGYIRKDARQKPAEAVQVHIFPTLQKKILQFKPIANDSFTLMSRLMHLQKYGGDTPNTITVGNASLRSLAKL